MKGPKWDSTNNLNKRNTVCLKSHCLYDSESYCLFPERMVLCVGGVKCNCSKALQFIEYEDQKEIWDEA